MRCKVDLVRLEVLLVGCGVGLVRFEAGLMELELGVFVEENSQKLELG